MSEIIGEETRAVGITSAMSPVVDVSRDPRWGRTYETFGEDPYLISQMGVSYIKGMQKNKTDGVACIAKHFLGYSETQGGLNTAVSRSLVLSRSTINKPFSALIAVFPVCAHFCFFNARIC